MVRQAAEELRGQTAPVKRVAMAQATLPPAAAVAVAERVAARQRQGRMAAVL